MADSIFHAFLPGMMGAKKPTPISTGGGYGGLRPPTPNPIPDTGFNPLGKKKPMSPSPIPGVPSYKGGITAPPTGGRGTLLGGS